MHAPPFYFNENKRKELSESIQKELVFMVHNFSLQKTSLGDYCLLPYEWIIDEIRKAVGRKTSAEMMEELTRDNSKVKSRKKG